MEQDSGYNPPANKRILYERPDRMIGWFERADAIPFGDGQNQSHSSQHPFGAGLVRAIDGDSGEPAWIKYAWTMHGPRPGPDGEHAYRQVSLDAAGKWFAENHQELPEIWFEDKKRTNAPGKPRTQIPRPSSPPASPKRPPLAEDESHSPDRIQTVDRLVEMYLSLWWFHQQMESSTTPTFEQEKIVLPRFTHLADALRCTRPLMSAISDWPTSVQRAIGAALRAFDATTGQWGWEGVAQPEPGRSAYLEQCRHWAEEELERPMYEAALAISAGWDRPDRCLYDDMADEARRRGMVVTMSLEEGLAKAEPARSRLNSEPHIGKCHPKLGEQEHSAIVGALNTLRPHMLEIAPDRCTHPPWQVQSLTTPRSHTNSPEMPTLEQADPVAQPLKVICPLHGILTLAAWQRALSDLAGNTGWLCRLDRWSYGRFSVVAFLTHWTREAKLRWLRRQYDAEIHDRRLNIERGQLPSVVAHSFGTYILGYTLLRFDFIRFDKVILCGSILPVDFPWDKLIERGQVQAVRHEYGVRDPWVRRVRWFVSGTGPSGATGFTCRHERLEQEEFEYAHSDYFGADHMEDRWIPFLNKPLTQIPRAKDRPRIPRPRTSSPWGLYGLAGLGVVLSLSLVTAMIVWWWRR